MKLHNNAYLKQSKSKINNFFLFSDKLSIALIYRRLVFCLLMQHIWPCYIVSHDPCKIVPECCRNIVALVAVTKIKATLRVSSLAVSSPSADISANISISNNMCYSEYALISYFSVAFIRQWQLFLDVRRKGRYFWRYKFIW